jgi:hypothetical protein
MTCRTLQRFLGVSGTRVSGITCCIYIYIWLLVQIKKRQEEMSSVVRQVRQDPFGGKKGR